MKDSFESKLQMYSICSIGIRSRNQDIIEFPLTIFQLGFIVHNDEGSVCELCRAENVRRGRHAPKEEITVADETPIEQFETIYVWQTYHHQNRQTYSINANQWKSQLGKLARVFVKN